MKKERTCWDCLVLICNKGFDREKVFNDFLDVLLFAQLSFTDNAKRGNHDLTKLTGQYEEDYLNVLARYTDSNRKEIADLFAEAYKCILSDIVKGESLDPLGELYMKEVSRGDRGQFFTPAHVCELMATLAGEIKDGETVCDPCCGSGSMLLAKAKKNKNIILFGTDIDERCAKMTTLNLVFRDLTGVVQWGNTLSQEIWKTWYITKGLVEQQ